MPGRTFLSVICFLAAAATAAAQGSRAHEPLVEVRGVEPTIVVELRYATSRNPTGKPIYPPDMPCWVREGVAQRLKHAQHLLQQRGYRLKIWDAYRPPWAHQKLWDAVRDPEFVADPKLGGSLHSHGVAVDVTLVDRAGRELRMPTDFDVFTPAAAMRYRGGDRTIRRNLQTLQQAMAAAGFLGMRDEWWHFIVKDWKDYAPAGMKSAPPDAPSR